MIFLFFTLLMGVEIFIHWFLIEICNLDTTPDRKFSLSTVLVLVFRAITAYIPWLCLAPDIYNYAHVIMYLMGVVFLHLLIFSPALNMTRGSLSHLSIYKRLSYLGNGWVDSAIKAVTYDHIIGRIFFFSVLAAGGIYGFYNTHWFDSNLTQIYYDLAN